MKRRLVLAALTLLTSFWGEARAVTLDEIAAGEIVYRPGPRVEPVKTANNPIAAAMVDVDDDLDDDEERASDADEENEDGETTVSRRRMDEFDDEELDDGDIPEEDR